MNKQALNHSLEFIDGWLKLRYEQIEIPGFTVAVAHKGKIIFSRAYGCADLESNKKLTTDNIFRIASHSKTFTATALMQLQEKHKLRIDDYVVDYLPWLEQHKDKRWQKVTLRQIMSHGAGIIRDGLRSDYWQLDRPFPDANELRQEILESSLILDNNVRLKYSNFGYSLLGMVIEAVSGQTYNSYVTEHIVEALKLNNTGPEYSSDIDKQLVTGYSRREANKIRLPIDQIDTRAMSAATGFYSTAEDLCKYFSAHIVGSNKLLDDESKKEMQRVHFHAYSPGQTGHEDYGLGLEIEFVEKRKVLGHGGGFPGHITESLFDPKDELVVVALTNCMASPATQIVKGIYSVIDYFQHNTPSTKPKHDLSKLEGCYMSLFGITNIVVTGDKVVGIYPNSWRPFDYIEELERVDDATLRVKDTDSFSSEGELVKFEIDNNKVKTVNYCGGTMWPKDVWAKKQKSRKRVSLDNN